MRPHLPFPTGFGQLRQNLYLYTDKPVSVKLIPKKGSGNNIMTRKAELEARGYKTYENEDIQVFWKPRLCQHVGECARGNYNVFNPQRRSYIW